MYKYMKKIVILLLAIIGSSGYSNAQGSETDLRERFMVGLKMGVNYSNVYDSRGDAFRADSKFGFVTGTFAAIPIGKYIGVQPEILFSQKGFQGTGRILGEPYSFTRTTNFIDVPLLFAFKPSEFLTLLAGPQYSYLLSQRDVFENAYTSIAQEELFVNDNIRKNILCLTTGIELTLKHFLFNARVGWDVHNNNGDGFSSTPRYKNIWYQTTVGYRFYQNR